MMEVIGENLMAFGCGRNLLLYNIRNSDTRIIDVSEANEKTEAKEENDDSKDKSSEDQIVAIKMSPNGLWLAVACERKMVTVWCTQKWKLICSHILIKKPVNIAITSDSAILLVADKSGDVYHFPLKGCTSENDQIPVFYQEKNEDETAKKLNERGLQPLMGHISMLLDLAITEDMKYIITCDRDEKIRVSHYPNSYNIEAFCLGHTEFVTQVSLLPKSDHHILSCSGDGTFRLWNYLKGACVAYIDTREQTNTLLHHYEKYKQQRINESEEARRYLPDYPAVLSFSLHPTSNKEVLVAAVLDRIPAAFLYKVDGQEMKHISTVELEAEPKVVAWSKSGELIVMQKNEEQPLSVFSLFDSNAQEMTDHNLVSFGKKHKHLFKGEHKWLNLDILYKQRYDNVADYMKKKEERLTMEKAAKDGLIPTYKKGRWSK